MKFIFFVNRGNAQIFAEDVPMVSASVTDLLKIWRQVAIHLDAFLKLSFHLCEASLRNFSQRSKSRVSSLPVTLSVNLRKRVSALRFVSYQSWRRE